MYWSINPHVPKGYPRWRWVCVNLWRKLLYFFGLHWKRRRVELTWYRFTRLVRGAMMERNERWDGILRQEPCVYCQRVLDFDKMTIEHVVPKSRGGLDTSLNKVGCCATCNQKRGSMPLLHYLLRRQGVDVNKAARNFGLARQAAVRMQRGQEPNLEADETRTAHTRHYGGESRWKRSIVQRDQKDRKPTDVDLRRARG